MVDMTDVGGMSLSKLGDFNFNDVDSLTRGSNVNDLLGRPGRVSIDDNGKLVLVNPQDKPDNRVVRFFKGIRNPEYRAEQRTLLRANILAKNESFNSRLTSELIKFSRAEFSAGNAIAPNDEFSVKGLAAKAVAAAPSGELNLVDLKQLIDSTANRFQSALVPEARNCFTDNCTRSDVIFKGKACTVYDFLTKHMPPESNNGRVPRAETLGAAIVKHCAFHPEIMKFILPKEDGARMGVLLSDPNVTGKGKDELRNLASKAMNSLVGKLNALTQQALERGCDPQSVSNLMNDALWQVGRSDARTLEKGIFDTDNANSIASKLAALPGGTPAAPADAQTRSELDAVKAKLPGLNDSQAAKVLSFCATHHMKVDSYADFVQSFGETQKSIIRFGTGQMRYGDFRDAKDAVGRAIDNYTAAHPNAQLGVDDWNNVGAAVVFHAALTDSLSGSARNFVKDGPKTVANLSELIAVPQNNQALRDSEMRELSHLNNLMTGMLIMTSGLLEGTNGTFLGKTDSVSDLKDLVLMDRVRLPQMQEHIRQSVADVEPQYQKGLAAYLEGALRATVDETHAEARAEDLVPLKNKAVNDPKFMSVLSDAQVLTPEIEAKYRDFLINHQTESISSGLEFALSKPSNFDADGFNTTFDKDVARGLFSEINGHPATKDVAEVRREFSELVPREFIPAMSSLCMQGGIPACLNYIINFPEQAGDNGRYNQLDLTRLYDHPFMHMGHATQLRREDDILYLNLQMEQTYSHFGDDPYGRFRLSIEVAVNLKGGVDERGMPNSISITHLGNEPRRR